MNTIEPTQVEEVAKLELVVKESGVELSTAQGLIESFAPIFREVHDLIEQAKAAPKVTDATQLSEMKACRELRLALKEKRVEGNKLRERLKKDSLLRGSAIQGCYSILALMTEPLEAHLEEQEKFAERAEAARKAMLAVDRAKALAEFNAESARLDLANMPEAAFAALLAGAEKVYDDRMVAEYKAKQAKEAAEKAEREAREAQRLENERLKKEAAEREAAIRLEREKIRVEQEAAAAKAKAELEAEQAKSKKEREAMQEKADADAHAQFVRADEERKAREKAESELAAKKKAEADAEKARLAAARAAKAAPDKEKFLVFAKALQTMPAPEVDGESARKLALLIVGQKEKLAQWIISEAEKL